MENKLIGKVCCINVNYATFISGNICDEVVDGDTCIVLEMRTDAYFVAANDCYMIVLSKIGLCEVHASDLEVISE